MKLWINVYFLAMLGLAGNPVSALTFQEDSFKRSVDYVDGLDMDCTLTDGYRCAEVKEETYMDPDSLRTMMSAAYLQARQIAYDDFLNIPDLTEAQKDLKHYKVGFTESDDQYIVVILGLALPYIDDQGQVDGIVNAVYGRSMKYWIDKKTRQISKRVFFK